MWSTRGLAIARDRIANLFLRCARSAATDAGWSRICDSLGAPGMLSGLLSLRERGVNPRFAVDAGACVGDWARLFRSVFPEAQLLMVEAQPSHREVLSALCERAGSKLRFSSTLLGPPGLESSDFVVLDDSSGGTGSSVLPENSNVPRHVVRLPMTTLDQLLAHEAMPAPEFIKLDVQGYELEVLKGAKQALRTAEFVLLEVSLWPYNQGSPLLADVAHWMAQEGFRAYEIFDISRRADGVLLQIDVLFARTDSALLRDVMTHY